MNEMYIYKYLIKYYMCIILFIVGKCGCCKEELTSYNHSHSSIQNHQHYIYRYTKTCNRLLKKNQMKKR